MGTAVKLRKRKPIARKPRSENQGLSSRSQPPVSSLARHNTPELIRRRAARTAEANANYSKESDDALANILAKFQKLTF